MELQEMKSLWEDMSQKVDEQKILTDKLIIEMTRERYSNKIRSISVSEIAGALICFATALYITINFGKLDNWYLQLSGFITVAASIILPVISLKAVKKMKAINISKSTYKEALLNFSLSQKRFLQIQKITFYLSFLILLTAVLVFGKLFKNIDIFETTEKLNWMIPSGIGALYIFVIWVYRRYTKITNAAQNILNELAD